MLEDESDNTRAIHKTKYSVATIEGNGIRN